MNRIVRSLAVIMPTIALAACGSGSSEKMSPPPASNTPFWAQWG
jgi:hypothetical protein